ncbi:nuclear transport factor 2 family protein [Streptomyces sp. GbtcB6]|uniref:nuclear transport factor 2 family protein n=1 Tax=unclassified Streptomyces TaxID=2593676 RepID=UPI00267413E9|nr:nuclear transport factor 2 family protein [Streptomyces sp. GbtcB6]
MENLTFEAEAAVRALPARMYVALDSHDVTGYAGLFTEDGRLDTPFGKPNSRAEIFEWTDGYISEGNEDGVRHFITNIIVDPHPDGARLRCYIQKWKVDVGPTALGTGSLDIIAVREGSEWRIKSNTISIDPPYLA